MEQILGILFVIYLIFSFVSALTKKQERPEYKPPGDDAPWPHLEGVEVPDTEGAPWAEPADDATDTMGWPTHADTRGPGPIWTDLFGDPRRTGSPLGWPTGAPGLPGEMPGDRIPEPVVERVESTDSGLSGADGTSPLQIPTHTPLEPERLERELAESRMAVAALSSGSSAALPTASRKQGNRPPFELTADSLREAVLYTEVLGPPRALRPYRPPHWKL